MHKQHGATQCENCCHRLESTLCLSVNLGAWTDFNLIMSSHSTSKLYWWCSYNRDRNVCICECYICMCARIYICICIIMFLCVVYNVCMYICTYMYIICMSHQYMYSCNIYAQITLHLLTSVKQIYVAS